LLSAMTVPAFAQQLPLAAAAIRCAEPALAPYAPHVPGAYNIPLLAGLRGTSIRPILCKTETGAGFIACGVAWETGRTALALSITGPGLTNFLTPLACAKHERHPILLLSGEVPSSAMGRRAVQDGSDLGSMCAARVTEQVTALSVAADGPVKALQAVSDGVRVAHARRMPVHVNISLDALTTPVEARAGVILTTCVCSIDAGAIADAIRLAQRARRPAILIGRGARNVGSEIVALAEALGAAVLSTPSSKGIFPETHPLSAGAYSYGHRPLAHKVMQACDYLLVIASGLGEFASRNWWDGLSRKVLVRVDDDPVEISRNFLPAVPILGDAAAAVRALATEAQRLGRSGTRWFAPLAESVDQHRTPRGSARGGVEPASAFSVLQQNLPRDGRVVVDIGTASALAVHYLTIERPQRFYLPIAYACVGHALAASVGVRVASGASTVVVAGDAAFLANSELHTAVEEKLGSLVYVILNNHGNYTVEYGVRAQFGAGHGIPCGAFRRRLQVAAIARAMGAQSVVARSADELGHALRAGLDAHDPFVIDLRMARVPPPMLDRVEFLRGAHANHRQGG
jgi:acetolactate synthase I/II/III large subunit